MAFPAIRPRRNRKADWSRRLVQETRPSANDLVWSLIVHDGPEPLVPVDAMPGVSRMNVDEASKAAIRAEELGIPAIAIFPNIDSSKKDEAGTEALNPDGLVPQCIQAMKAAAPNVGIICDVALDPYTTHGHDGLINEDGYVLNDITVSKLVEQALVQAQAGADMIAPSDMMDGRIWAIREAFEEDGFVNTQILAYAAKYASAWYGPYRDAVGSATALKGDKKTYQMDFGNTEEAILEVALDIEEGADMVMVKPGLAYLDIVQRVSSELKVPTLAFHVSGEYAAIKASAQQGWIDEKRARLEVLAAFKRAGASGIVTYRADELAEWLD